MNHLLRWAIVLAFVIQFVDVQTVQGEEPPHGKRT